MFCCYMSAFFVDLNLFFTDAAFFKIGDSDPFKFSLGQQNHFLRFLNEQKFAPVRTQTGQYTNLIRKKYSMVV